MKSLFFATQDPSNPERLYIGAGIWNDDDNHMKPAVLALETSTGILQDLSDFAQNSKRS